MKQKLYDRIDTHAIIVTVRVSHDDTVKCQMSAATNSNCYHICLHPNTLIILRENNEAELILENFNERNYRCVIHIYILQCNCLYVIINIMTCTSLIFRFCYCCCCCSFQLLNFILKFKSRDVLCEKLANHSNISFKTNCLM